MKKFFSDIDPDKKSNILKYTGIAVLVFALFTLISSVSYLFTWHADQSLLSNPEMMEKGVEVKNWGGKLGFMWSRFLVAGCFGLGSFALVFLMGAVAYRLFFWKRHIGLLRTTFVTVSGTFLSSLILAFVSMAFGSDTAFGGGFGGDAGHAVISWMANMTGFFITGLILVALAVAWLLLSNGRFAGWFAAVGDNYGQEPQPVQEPEEGSLTSDDVAPIEIPEEYVMPKEEPFVIPEEEPFIVPEEPVVAPDVEPVAADQVAAEPV